MTTTRTTRTTSWPGRPPGDHPGTTVVVALCRPRAREVAPPHGHAGTRKVTPGCLKSHHNIAAHRFLHGHALPSTLGFRVPHAGFLWKLCPGALISLLVWQLITMCTRFQTCKQPPLKTHIIGIIAHEDLRKTSGSPCRRSISEAPAQHKQQ